MYRLAHLFFSVCCLCCTTRPLLVLGLAISYRIALLITCLCVCVGLACKFSSLSFIMTALLPVYMEVLEHVYPVLAANPTGAVWNWLLETVKVTLKRRKLSSSGASAGQPDLMRPFVSVVGLDELTNDGALLPARTAHTPRKRPPVPHISTMSRPAVDRKMLVLDLDETLVHSSSRPQRRRADLQFAVEINSSPCTFFVLKRPFVDWYLRQVCSWYDVVVFTASLRKYADPVIDMLSVNGPILQRLFREACSLQQGAFLKDLHTVSKDLSSVMIIDNSPGAYSLQKENAIPIEGWYDDPHDKALLQLLPLLHLIRDWNGDVRPLLARHVVHPSAYEPLPL
eukprot:TRINITY_DN5637_c0_g1_i1.p1 TRINITY_DN5637_c0_g1~~TRINITY_DN5637_c0_g1_i1.p1  ORF type:complete len:340 (+),score=72.02 TRINITY_DN5637_c0_g1_i1:459-1478(+)